MPSLTLTVPHQLGQQAAIDRIKPVLASLQERYQSQIKDLEQSWAGNVLNFVFRTMGMNIKGEMSVDDDQVKVDGTIPMAALMFKGKIEQTLRDELTKLLS